MSAFIRYPLFGCVILALSACGGSGSSRLLVSEPAAPPMDGNGADPQEVYSSVDYLISSKGLSAAIAKFTDHQVYQDAEGNKYLLTNDNVTNKALTDKTGLPSGVDLDDAPSFADLFAVYKDADGNEYLLTPDNVTDMNLTDVELPEGVETAPAFADLTRVREGGARALGSTPAQLNGLRNGIVGASTRYLSTGAVLAQTGEDGSVASEAIGATCSDATATGPAKCVFGKDNLREDTTFHLGPAGSTDDEDENVVSFRSFTADRQPVMFYRETFLSQVRTTPSVEADRREVYEDEDGREYLLTGDNVTNKALTAKTGLPSGVDLDDAPSFADLFAVYEDDDDNRYLLTPDAVMNMDLTSVELPMGVTTAPDFASLSKVRESLEDDNEEYVGYDGMLRHSMFFVGVYRFFDDEETETPAHVRYANASLGRIYDENAIEDGIQPPSVELTGEGVMVGVESRKTSLEHYLVQGDVKIDYKPSVEADDTVTPNVMVAAANIGVKITNIKRLNDDGEAWYAGTLYSGALTWEGLTVTDSKFSDPGQMNNLVAGSRGALQGSLYGTKAEPEVGGVFHHEGTLHQIIGSFGSKLAEPPDDDDDSMDPM
ncbi:MAG: hypothetical protein OXC38_01405 [Gammaproteobacteria bacterium]|nr:hypothetical protein [Gammaproteobacteria bacterium]